MSLTFGTPRVLTPRDVMTVIVIPWKVMVSAGTAKEQIRLQRQFRIQEVAGSLATAGSTATLVDINVNGASILTTKLRFDAGEKTTRSSSIPYVLSDTDFDVDDEFVFDVDQAGTGAEGLKVYLIGWQLGGQE